MSDCFQCAYRDWRSRTDPDLIGCSKKYRAFNYKDIDKVQCESFQQATKQKIEAQLYFDNAPLTNNIDCE